MEHVHIYFLCFLVSSCVSFVINVPRTEQLYHDVISLKIVLSFVSSTSLLLSCNLCCSLGTTGYRDSNYHSYHFVSVARFV